MDKQARKTCSKIFSEIIEKFLRMNKLVQTGSNGTSEASVKFWTRSLEEMLANEMKPSDWI